MNEDMEMEDDVVTNGGELTLTYMSRLEHTKDYFLGEWKAILICWVVFFGVFWGVIEALSFFYSKLNLNNLYVLFLGVFFCLIASIFRCASVYKNNVPRELSKESSLAHEIAMLKKPFWEYGLAYELIKNRVGEIDQIFDDVMNNRVHIQVTKTLGVESYIEWLQTRPENLIRIVAVAKQLLVFDLIDAVHADDENNFDYNKLLRVAELIKKAYDSAYDFEVEGRQLSIPEEFKLLHEMQTGWTSVVRDGFHQMLKILQSVAARDKEDFSPVTATITFDAPPSMDEFDRELERLARKLRKRNGWLGFR